jgi:hypothetical protein
MTNDHSLHWGRRRPRRARNNGKTWLSHPERADEETFNMLRGHLMDIYDQRWQLAAIQGLAYIGGPQAVLILAERLCDYEGITAIKRSISALRRLAVHGGLLALSATILLDQRTIHEKLDALAQGAEAARYSDSADQIRQIAARFTRSRNLADDLPRLCQISCSDVRVGATLACAVHGNTYHPLLNPSPRTPYLLHRRYDVAWLDDNDIELVVATAQERLPGLVALLSRAEPYPSRYLH